MKKSKRINKSSLYKSKSRIFPVVIKDISIKFDQFTEIFENINIGDCLTVDSKLNLNKLIKKLQKNYNIFCKDKIIRYYLHQGNIWLKCPKILKHYLIDESDYMPYEQVKLHMVNNNLSLINVVMKQEQVSEDDSQQQQYDEEDNDQEGRCRRLKQRKIKHVIQKVLKWRQLYAGMQNGKQIEDKVPLDQGALIVKISKKTLDDYLAQLKKGRRYGFNFNQHKNDKIGVLRQFIRKAERKNKN